MAALWLALVVFATGFYLAPRGTEAQPTWDDAVDFGASLAIAGAAAATVAFCLGGRRSWAGELALCVVAVVVIVALLLGYFLWFDPSFVRRSMNFWEFQPLQHGSLHWAQQLAGYHGPLGAAVGISLGAGAGLLIGLWRRRPRLATGVALVVPFAFASVQGQQLAFDLVTRFGWLLRRLFVPWSIASDQISVTAMIFGGIAGAVVASLAMYATRGSSRVSEKV